MLLYGPGAIRVILINNVDILNHNKAKKYTHIEAISHAKSWV